ncbi:DNA N-6-adenine-methyltransferase [Sphingomonas sp. HH69]
MADIHGLGPSKSDDWYTPKSVFDALGAHFDLDVAAPFCGPLHVPCDGWIYDRSLERAWCGFIWMNPPFGSRNGLEPWMEKFFLHGNGIALTPDRTSAPWFQAAWQKTDAVLFTRKLKFIRPCGSDAGNPGNGTALWASGKQAAQCLAHAEDAGFGILAQPRLRAPSPAPPLAAIAEPVGGGDFVHGSIS